MANLIGQPLRRTEDQRLLTGAGAFADDVNLPGQVYAAFVRAPHAHADVTRIDTGAATNAPGVLAVLTGADYAADGLGALLHYAIGVDHLDISKPGFRPENILHDPLPAHIPIAGERVRHIGEIVAMVVAESEGAAHDAADLIDVDYAPLPAVTDARAALAADAPGPWPGGNLCLKAENGDTEAVAQAFARAAHTVSLESLNQRISGTPMELRAAVGEYDAATDLHTLHAPSQGVHRHKNAIVNVFGATPDKVRIVTGDVGGGFGVRTPCYPEYALVVWAAKRLGRPVKWASSRTDFFVSDFQARDVFIDGAMALDADGRILGIELGYVGNLGAYPASFSVYANVLRMAGGTYDIPAAHVTVQGVLTNTVTMTVLRGAGRPESTFIIERLLDLAADKLGLDRGEIRRRNLIPPAALPYTAALGHTYDSGTFAANMARIRDLMDWDGFPARRKAAAARGRLAGIGLSNYLESPTGAPNERADVTVHADGRIDAILGTQDSGQGHKTAFAQVVAEALDLDFETVEIRYGDTDFVMSGGGTHSDRSLRLGGTALVRAIDAIIADGKQRAADLLEAGIADIEYGAGQFRVAGTDRAVGLFELAAKTQAADPLAATNEIAERLHAHPNGCAGVELEIDAETGAIELTRYVSVDDVGRVINPMIVEGQVHGGIALGLGQSLMEQILYDDAGQLLTGSFIDYAIPRADDMPPLVTENNEQPAPSNPLGVKGAGECGTTPAGAAVIAAITDALQEFGVRHLEMPATPEKVWRAIQNGPPKP